MAEANPERLKNAAIIGATLMIILLFILSITDLSNLGGGGGVGGSERKIITPYESMPLGDIFFKKTQTYSIDLGSTQISPHSQDVMLYENNETTIVSKKSLFLGRGTDSIIFNFIVNDYDTYFVDTSQQILLQFTITEASSNPLTIKLNNKEIFKDTLPKGLQIISLDKTKIQLNNKVEILTDSNLWETSDYTLKNIKLYSHNYNQNLATKHYTPGDSSKFKAGMLKFDITSVEPNPPAKLEIKHNGFGIFDNDVAPVAPYSTPLFTNIYAGGSSNIFSFYATPPFKINISNIRVIYWDGVFVTKEVSFNIPKLKNEKQLKVVFFVNETQATLPHEPIYIDLTTRASETQKGIMNNPASGPNSVYFKLPADFTEGTTQLTFSTESSKPYNISKVQLYLI
ncbi:MAG: hypothetical protein CVU81_00590 [Euryarchaeota archaeon HGW-Euryarchaeota-1]|nr:MAG: hypothetical protein CVU81_00590 [Euryarchaeota archaeon HGW-Euryarchaeota-1]